MADAYIILGLISLVLISVFFFEVFAYVATKASSGRRLARSSGRRGLASRNAQRTALMGWRGGRMCWWCSAS